MSRLFKAGDSRLRHAGVTTCGQTLIKVEKKVSPK